MNDTDRMQDMPYTVFTNQVRLLRSEGEHPQEASGEGRHVFKIKKNAPPESLSKTRVFERDSWVEQLGFSEWCGGFDIRHVETPEASRPPTPVTLPYPLAGFADRSLTCPLPKRGHKTGLGPCSSHQRGGVWKCRSM
jgi:hypothetical protein